MFAEQKQLSKSSKQSAPKGKPGVSPAPEVDTNVPLVLPDVRPTGACAIRAHPTSHTLSRKPELNM